MKFLCGTLVNMFKKKSFKFIDVHDDGVFKRLVHEIV